MANRGLDRFWGACGSAAPLRLLVWERGRREPVEHRLGRPFAIIGRTAPADLVLDHPQVSRRHAFLQLIDGRAYCLDLGSRSAIGWAGGIRRSGWIDPGRPVEIGPYRIGVLTGTDANPAAIAAPGDPPDRRPPDSAGPGRRILLESIDEATPDLQRRTIDRVLTTVGRAPDCHLRLGDLSVSRIHCALIRLGEGVWVVDLHGRGGVLINGRRRRWAPLVDGSQLKIGRYLFTVRVEPPPLLRLRDDGGMAPALPAPERNPISLPMPAPLALAGPARRPGPSPPALFGAVPATLRPPATEPVTIEFAQADPVRIAEAMIAPLIDQFTLMQQQLFDQYHHSMMEMMGVFARMQHEHRGHVDREMRRIRRLTREVRSLRQELDRHREEEARAVRGPAPGIGLGTNAELPKAAPLPTTPQGSPEEYRAAQARIIARMTELQQERQGRWQRLLGRLSGGGADDDR